jgi:hypothetical protein
MKQYFKIVENVRGLKAELYVFENNWIAKSQQLIDENASLKKESADMHRKSAAKCQEMQSASATHGIVQLNIFGRLISSTL